MAGTAPTLAISVRVTRTGSSARIDVASEHADERPDDVIGSMTVPLGARRVERGRRAGYRMISTRNTHAVAAAAMNVATIPAPTQ